MMKIAVCIKQVPDTRGVKMDEATGTVVRDGVELIVNPLDLYAIELALQLRERYGAEVDAFSMGPPQAAGALREALAMGIDNAYLVCGREFAGSDTWSTGYALSEAIRSQGPYQLLICGERATDGDTGQVGPGIAAALEWPVAAYVNHFHGMDEGGCDVSRILEHGVERLTLTLPAVITVVKEVGEPRLPTLRGKLRAKAQEIPVLDAGKLGLKTEWLGLKGSPTRVVKIFHPQITRECVKLPARDERERAAAIPQALAFIREAMP